MAGLKISVCGVVALAAGLCLYSIQPQEDQSGRRLAHDLPSETSASLTTSPAPVAVAPGATAETRTQIPVEQAPSAQVLKPTQTVAPAPVPAQSAPARHARWDRWLKKYVSAAGWVDYTALQKNGLPELDAYLQELAATRLSDLGNPKEEMAFWINAYNTVCIRTLVDHKLPKEVPNTVFFGANIFKEERYEIVGKVRTLDEIEHEILRVKFKDNRVHAAVVCGASSCPRLRPEAYTGDQLDAQLDEEARYWISVGKDLSGKRKNYLDRSGKTFYASKIFSWFQEDFGDSDAGVLQFIKRFATVEDRAFLNQNRVRLRFLDYDWALNRHE